MIELDWSRCATVPRQHQKDGVKALLQLPAMLLADEVGAGKSKQIIDTAQLLYESNQIDTIVVLCPAAARGVWANPHPALGEVAKHGWPTVPNFITEFSVNHPKITFADAYSVPGARRDLLWIVSNYEYIRRPEHLATMLKLLAGQRFWLVTDEGWALKDAKTAQWKAAKAIRKLAARITILNGTPVADTPLDLYAQMKLLDPSILGYKYFSHFRARYAIMKPNVSFPMITGWQNLEELREKVAPYVLRRTTRECFDLPPILEPVLLEARLSETTWKLYKQMRDNMVAWLKDGEASIAQQAIVKGMRLAQITSGFLGGIQQVDADGLNFEDGPSPTNTVAIQEIGREKLDTLLGWLDTLSPVPQRLLIWCRFRAEVERTAEALAGTGRKTYKLYGSQSVAEREEAVVALNPDIPQDGLIGVVGHAKAGGAALNLAGASVAVYMSNDFNLRLRLQSMGRIDRSGQRQPIRYVDVVATGPKGQRTMDHHVLAALRGKEDVAKWTVATWKKALLSE